MRQDEGEEHDNGHDAHLQHLGQHEHGEEHHEDMLSHPHLASLSTSLFLFPIPYMIIFIIVQNSAKEFFLNFLLPSFTIQTRQVSELILDFES